MTLNFIPDEARKADRFSNFIQAAGKYVGTITRAEKLLSRNSSPGLGLSFKADDGSTAAFLDLYTHNNKGDVLQGFAIVQALMCCLKLRTAKDGKVTFDTWDRKQKTADGYPDIQGKRIGFVFRKELQTDTRDGSDQERLIIVGVFQAETGLMATEILEQKTKGELLQKLVDFVMANPVKDSRKKGAVNGSAYQRPSSPAPGREEGDPGFDDSEIPF